MPMHYVYAPRYAVACRQIAWEALSVKKLPIIGLIIGAIAAGFAMMKRKKAGQQTPDDTTPA